MRQYEVAIRIAQVHHLVDERKFRKALAVIETIDMRQVRNASDLKVFAEVFIRTERFDAAKATYLRIYKKSKTKRVLYRLIYLAIRTNDLDSAEEFYEEYLRMNPVTRDALILRYRIDKAAGVPISDLIAILEDLKQDEYIEEWAYELAKLYQQAGRYEECQQECEDILLWFGSGEIVERAKMLYKHIEGHSKLPFMDEKDYTDPVREDELPNPDDTGSLPDLSEYLSGETPQEKKLLKKILPAKFEAVEERMVAAADALAQEDAKESEPEEPIKTEQNRLTRFLFGNLEEQEEFEDDYEDDIPDKRDSAASKEDAESKEAEPEESQKIEAEETTITEDSENPPQQSISYATINPNDFPRFSQSGTGITQDLAKEISAIFEAEQQEQLKEKAVSVIQELPNVANQVVEKMTDATDQTETKPYTPFTSNGSELEEILPDEEAATQVIPDFSTNQLTDEAYLVQALEAELEEKEQEQKQEQKAEKYVDPALAETTQLPVADDNFAVITDELVVTKDEEPEPEDRAQAEGVQDIQGTAQAEGVRDAQNLAVDSQTFVSATGETLSEDDLPTTRALHRSFRDILILVGGELDPSHFVLMGDGPERILGISKKIALVMRETGFLSNGKIAHIDAEQLNIMDLSQYKKQLKGNCLLVTHAAELLFPTITRIFAIMDEYYGDFSVVLSDEGTTLDQLFRFVPALARRFKYVVDISEYTEQDYK